MSRRPVRAAVAIVAAAITLASCDKGGAPGQAQPTADRRCDGPTLEIGDALPGECVVTGFDGKPLTLAAAREGKPAVLNFWASWCVYCIKEMPDFDRVYDAAAGRVAFLGLDLLGVQAETQSQAQALAKKTSVSYPLAYDQDGAFYRRICPCGGRPLMPATLFVRDDGSIAYLKFGPLDEGELTSLIRTHLDEEF